MLGRELRGHDARRCWWKGRDPAGVEWAVRPAKQSGGATVSKSLRWGPAGRRQHHGLVPFLSGNGLPFAGNLGFGLELARARPTSLPFILTSFA